MESTFEKTTQNTLVIGGSTIPGVYILTPFIKKFQGKHAHVKITLQIGDTRKIINMVSQGAIEIGLVGARYEDKRLHFEEFSKDELVLAFSSNHPWNGRAEVFLDDLRQQPFILREVGSGTRAVLEKIFHDKGIDIKRDLRIACELGSAEAVKEGILAGVGVSILSRLAVARELKFGLLKISKIKGMHLQRILYQVDNVHRVKSPLCQEFLELLESEIRLPLEGPR